MRMLILISGLLPYDAGKTSVTLALAKSLKKRGIEPVVLKPVSAHNAWYQHHTLTHSKRLGILIGEDVYRYFQEGLIRDIDTQNPVDILTAPPDIFNFSSLTHYFWSLETVISQAVLVRLSLPYRRYFLLEKNLDLIHPKIKDEIMGFLEQVNEYTAVNREWIEKKLAGKEMGNYLFSLVDRLKRENNLLLVESFNDALFPVISISRLVDLIIIVAPGRGLIYRRAKIMKYLDSSMSLGVRARSLVELFKPDSYFIINPVDSGYPEIDEETLQKILGWGSKSIL